MNSAKRSLIGLKADAFRHPLDLEATRSLRQFPGLDLLTRNLLGPTVEQVFYLENLASSIRVGEKQLPDLYNLLLEACQVLDMEPPQLYIRQNPVPNAYTFAVRGKQAFVMIYTSLLELLNPAEIQAVIAHELGHLKCDHGVYLTPANVLVLAAELIPDWGLLIAQGLRDRLMEWVRCAEFTCDRAALLVSQDPKVVASVLMKLTGGSPSLAPKLNLDAFIAQAHTYDEVSATELGQMIREMQTAPLSHPLPVLRAREIDRWAGSQSYQSLLQGVTNEYNDEPTNTGGWRNW